VYPSALGEALEPHIPVGLEDVHAPSDFETARTLSKADADDLYILLAVFKSEQTGHLPVARRIFL
jgi:hypothetical protein